MKRILRSLFLLIVIPLCAYPSSVFAADATISAAICLKNAFEEIGKLYEAEHAAQSFIEMVRLKEGTVILKKYGFRIP